MQKKLLAVALLAAFSGAAAAQSANVTLYGRINTGLDNWKADGATGGSPYEYQSRNRVYDSGSRFGLRGTEDLGNGMRAFFVLEAGINVDVGGGTGQSGIANANATGSLGSRDSYVGIGGSWGDVRFGKQSFFWTGGTIDQVGANYLSAGNAVLSGTWNSHVTGAVSRQNNVMSYNSPNMNGFTVSAYYSPETAEATGPKGAATAAQTVSVRDRSWGLTGRYSNGPWALGADWATRNNNVVLQDAATPNIAINTGATGVPKWSGWKVMGAYTYAPGSQVSAGYTSMQNTMQNAAVFGLTGQAAASTVGCGPVNGTAAGVFGAAVLAGGSTITGPTAAAYCSGDNLKQNAWMLGVEHSFGNLMLIGQYGRAGDVKGSNAAGGMAATGWNNYTIGARYNLSKRTAAYASYNAMINQSNSYADINGGGMSSGVAGRIAATNIGADVKILSVGLWHSF